VVKVLLGNADKARSLVKALIPKIGAPRGVCEAGCERALEYAIITAADARDPQVVAKLQLVAGRVL
jgi:5'-methylthioadenosine phosphorylase